MSAPCVNSSWFAPWFWISATVHTLVLLGGGALFFHGAHYAVRTGVSSLEVNLVAAPQSPAIGASVWGEAQSMADGAALAEAPVGDVAVPDALEALRPVPKAVTQTPQPVAATNSRRPAPDAGQDLASARSSGGAYMEAKPNYLNNRPPVYPESARRARQEGLVILRVMVSAAGVAQAVELESGSGYRLLDESAQRAVQRWRFLPARLGSQAVSCAVTVPVRFRLDAVR